MVFHSVGGRPRLNKVKASGGCHRFSEEIYRAVLDKIWAQIRQGAFDNGMMKQDFKLNIMQLLVQKYFLRQSTDDKIIQDYRWILSIKVEKQCKNFIVFTLFFCCSNPYI
ncbi:hypothetical protein [Siminovitchia terrae]|uniref:Uncharacterized protein n=1 Tax=Siminovitchia terrae TaxID=1914933 RepID=A0A429X6V4_SIMTE|nr:hypothetical protein [Siminovitchia terrae]RST59134.1 hypothetical protein D5F11_013465 [Siminovitchia terrae]